MNGYGRKLVVSILLLIAAGVQAKAVWAETWPDRPVKLVVPFGAGGNTDVLARFIAERFSGAFKQQFIVENRPGAAGVIGAEFVARAPADGYTLLLASQPQILIVPAMRKTSYDPVRDFVPISNIGTIPFALVVRPGLPVTSLAEFIDFVRRRPRQLTYAVTGFGSVNHFTMLLLLKRAGIEMTPVTYKGGPEALADLLAGRVDAYFAGVSVVMTRLEAHGLRALAITSDHRFSGLAQVPTLAESGYPDLKMLLWEGLVAPSDTPTPVVDRMAAESARMAHDPIFARRLADIGIDSVGSTPQEFAATIAADRIYWREAVRVTGMAREVERQ
jgi:tripartite-type tricarboxylate transporter receptor subunit TctC